MAFNFSTPENNTEAALRLFNGVAYTTVFAVGLPLNISALWFFYKIQHWTTTHSYMFNLMLADFLLILFLPFRIFDSFYPIRPSSLCTFLICVHYSNMYVSIFTITAISVHRFVTIKFPMQSQALQTIRKTLARIVCFLIWIVVIAISTGFSPNMYPKQLKTCFVRISNRMSLSFVLVLQIVGYLLPVVIITTCSVQAIYTLIKSEKDNAQHVGMSNMLERKRIVAIIRANMIIFIVCFSPVHLGYLLRYFFACKSFSHILHEVFEWIATTNCCLDAVGYYILLKKVFRVNT